MKPIKILLPFSVWLMRTALILFAYELYFKTFLSFQIKFLEFYIAALFLIFSSIIFINGFIRGTTLTVVSGIVLSIITVYNIINSVDGNLDIKLVLHILIASITFYFISAPTKKY